MLVGSQVNSGRKGSTWLAKKKRKEGRKEREVDELWSFLGSERRRRRRRRRRKEEEERRTRWCGKRYGEQEKKGNWGAFLL